MRAAAHLLPICPRCGQPLHRAPRRLGHRLISIVYPVRYYTCRSACGWTGIRPAVSRIRSRSRRLLGVALALLLALCGIALARHLAPYWNYQHSDESLEESDTPE
jgi:hypothetical protein